jgi:metallo-beta-lactamase family protein
MLRDSAFIQEKDAEFVNKKRRKNSLPPIDPLYTVDDVDATIQLFQEASYGKSFEVIDRVECRFEDAGHILGSASVALLLRENSHNTSLAFTGDLGRPHLPILRDPVFIGNGGTTDYLISESTYGGRFHAPVTEMKDQLLEPLLRTCERKGKVVIPAFSVGRTQEIVYVLHELHQEGKLEKIPVYVDSPLSVNVTDVFRRHPECFDEETRTILNSPDNNDPFGFESLTYIRSVEESKRLNDAVGPCIIIAASGMCEAGRVTHHLANSIGDPRNMIMIAGYQAENTLGKKIVMKEPVVNIFGEPYALKAEVVVLNSFSGHADRDELLAYIRKFDHRTLKQVFLVHGDIDQAEKLAAGLQGVGFTAVSIPVRGQKVPLA